MATILDGKAIAAQVRAGLAERVQRLRPALGRAPGLGVVLIQVLINAAAAPLVFLGVQELARRVPSTEGDHVFHP